MKHPRPGRRRPRIIIPVASMADIAFQLIIFFMICSNFAREAGIAVKPPAAPDLDRLRQSNTVVAIDGQGQIYVQGRRVPDARSAETELADLLRTARTPEARTVLFRCDRATRRELFEPVLDAITRAGGIVAAIGEREERRQRPTSQETPDGK
ncbi:MAG: biopolymer transporter ExbD [Planctomycetes bacterium]|nr:biopolymer transporter ExbD [Planctomycetota bacterium]